MLGPSIDFNMGQQWHEIEQWMVSLGLTVCGWHNLNLIISSPCRWQTADIASEGPTVPFDTVETVAAVVCCKDTDVRAFLQSQRQKLCSCHSL